MWVCWRCLCESDKWPHEHENRRVRKRKEKSVSTVEKTFAWLWACTFHRFNSQGLSLVPLRTLGLSLSLDCVILMQRGIDVSRARPLQIQAFRLIEAQFTFVSACLHRQPLYQLLNHQSSMCKGVKGEWEWRKKIKETVTSKNTVKTKWEEKEEYRSIQRDNSQERFRVFTW